MTPEQFWSKVDKSGDCWEWIAGRRPDGYGQVAINRRPRRAHRVSWELTNGPIPAGMCVLHRCDNPPCVRPDHLWLGSKADNTADMLAKGRHQLGVVRRGDTHHNSHISERELVGLRIAHSQHALRVADEALRRGMSESALYRALTGGSYSHVGQGAERRAAEVLG